MSAGLLKLEKPLMFGNDVHPEPMSEDEKVNDVHVFM